MKVLDCLMLVLIASIVAVLLAACLAARGSMKCLTSHTGDVRPHRSREEPWACTVLEV